VGELGRIGPEGCLWLQGRAGRMITVAGRNVFPEALEACLEAGGGVVRAAVLPLADPLRGHRLVAVVQGDPAVEAQLRRRLAAAFPGAPVPGRYVWRQDWPVLPSGKTDLAALARGVGGA
jgi:long-chain acyl-CoA synthetase